MADRGDGWFDAEAALATAALRGGFLGGGEGEEAERVEGRGEAVVESGIVGFQGFEVKDRPGKRHWRAGESSRFFLARVFPRKGFWRSLGVPRSI